jgi:hypothetical protein
MNIKVTGLIPKDLLDFSFVLRCDQHTVYDFILFYRKELLKYDLKCWVSQILNGNIRFNAGKMK